MLRGVSIDQKVKVFSQGSGHCVKIFPFGNTQEGRYANIPVRVYYHDSFENALEMVQEYLEKYLPDSSFEFIEPDCNSVVFTRQVDSDQVYSPEFKQWMSIKNLCQLHCIPYPEISHYERIEVE